MKFLLYTLPSVPGTLEDRARLRPIARNRDRYQQMLQEVRSLASMADDAGFEVFGWFFDQGLMPWDEAQRQMEIFGKEIIPRFQ